MGRKGIKHAPKLTLLEWQAEKMFFRILSYCRKHELPEYHCRNLASIAAVQMLNPLAEDHEWQGFRLVGTLSTSEMKAEVIATIIRWRGHD